MASAAYQAIINAAETYLKATSSLGPSSSKSNKQIVNEIRRKIEAGEIDVDVADGTIINYISGAANNDNNSSIISGGPHGGYWYDPEQAAPSEAKPVEEQEIIPPEGAPVKFVERDLYPLMELWLQTKGYTAKDMSTLKGGGRWGNPDIIGADRVELFGNVDVELASCEVKLAVDNWEQVIFEAISHKRFSNRSWFCYRVSSRDLPLPKGMEYYAERYRVGVVQIVLSDDEIVALKANKKSPLDFIEGVIERVPAIYEPVPLREKRDLINRTGISLTLTF